MNWRTKYSLTGKNVPFPLTSVNGSGQVVNVSASLFPYNEDGPKNIQTLLKGYSNLQMKSVRRKQEYLWFSREGVIKGFNKLNIQYNCKKYSINECRDKIRFINNGKYCL